MRHPVTVNPAAARIYFRRLQRQRGKERQDNLFDNLDDGQARRRAQEYLKKGSVS